LYFFTSSTISIAQTSFSFAMADTEQIMIPNSNTWGLFNQPDGSIAYRKDSSGIRMWFTSANHTVLFRGNSFDTLTPYPIQNGRAVSVYGPSGTGFDSSYAGAYPVIPAANGHDLLMFYHAENHPCNSSSPFLGGIGLARSTDGGITWQRRGQVISTAAPKPTDCNFQIWGVGNPAVYRSPDSLYLYMLFIEWLRGNPVVRHDVLYLARAPIASDGEPGSWMKYSNGTFSEPGLGGLGTPVINRPPPNDTTTVYAGLPSVSWNVSLKRYLVIFQSRAGFHVATSTDGVQWDTPRLIWAQPDFYKSTLLNIPGVAYPTLISTEQPSQMTTSASGYIYYARGYPNSNPPHIMVRRPFRIYATSRVNPPTSFALAQNYPNPFNPVTQIEYELPRESHVSLKIYSIFGQVIAILINGTQEAGYKSVKWNAVGVASGVYFYRLQAGSYSEVKKLVLMK